jgi:hypothetical protein
MGRKIPMRKSDLRGNDKTTFYLSRLTVLFLYFLFESEFLVIDERLTQGQEHGRFLLVPMCHALRSILSTGPCIGVSCCAQTSSCPQCIPLPILLLRQSGQVEVLESYAHVPPSPCMVIIMWRGRHYESSKRVGGQVGKRHGKVPLSL